ncbi:unnamed protein product [Sphagnum troendelagicum]|uniref:Uncharacterized protein n=1 Tax=Sphagnum troendelagicum TaxID=128251 RepID=A0ABP0U3M0_9BRYO
MDFFGRLPWELQPGASLVKRSPLPLMVWTSSQSVHSSGKEYWSIGVLQCGRLKDISLCLGFSEQDRVSERSPPLSLSCCTVLWQSASAGFQKQFENGLHAGGREVTSR